MGQSLRTPLGRVRGLGSAKGGTHDHIAQRASAVALAPLAVWFVFSAATGLDGTYESARAFVAQPLNAVLLTLFAVAAFYHMRFGMRIVVEDYIHKHGTKQVLLLLNAFTWIVLAVAVVFAILRVNFGG